ncbi:3-isopropylmalate dehydrogenase [Brucella gallinifaecis]|uniref:3-isopropylmalate dehydrogenase n=1 Tax=Brucella gallinifaecis TaxID=215590 RepID=A0A502BGD2_9HYPH|nr:3-isopropylmalate dehydrogenase [Brucella gallinifaecis]TPF73932.1 3-isopropylmalate dehydrogenase [Brucella gallinifaecis]
MKIAVLGGDGIGPEVTAQSVKILEFLRSQGVGFELETALIGGCAYEAEGDPLPAATFALCQQADAILFGAEGGFQYETLPRGKRPGDALLTIRRELSLFANFRPIKAMKPLIDTSPLKRELVEGLDMLILRELTSDIYFGVPRGESINTQGQREAINTMYYNEQEIRNIARVGFETARKRKGKLCSVDKANVLEAMELWRDVVTELGAEYPDIELSHLYIDAAAMSLLRAPKDFDVILTPNLFGDILSDEASMLCGSIGLLPSASFDSSSKGLYEPVHGCAPDIAGKDVANPLASILSTAMMLRHSFDMEKEASALERAVEDTVAAGLRSADIAIPNGKILGTQAMGDAVLERFRALL